MPERLPAGEYPHQEICFADRITAWQNLLDGLPESSPDREKYEQEALENLNNQWKYIGEDCILFGQIVVGLVSQSDGRIKYAKPAVAEDTPGTSDGFGIFTFIEDGVPRKKLAYIFRTTSASPIEIVSGTTVEYTREAMYALNPTQSRILFSSDFESTLDLHGMAQQQSDELVAFMHSAEFLILQAREQQEVIDRHTTQAWQQMNTLQPELKEVLCQGRQAYVLPPTKDEVLRFNAISIENKIVRGELVGLEVLETQQLALGKAIRHTSELVDEQAGLCLTIIPDAATAAQFDLQSPDLLYIPISSQDLEIVFGQESVKAE